MHYFVSPVIEPDGEKAHASWMLWQPCTLTKGSRPMLMSAVTEDDYLRTGVLLKLVGTDNAGRQVYAIEVASIQFDASTMQIPPISAPPRRLDGGQPPGGRRAVPTLSAQMISRKA